MDMVRGIIRTTACPGCGETCQVLTLGPMDPAAQNLRAWGAGPAAGKRDKLPPRPLADPNDWWGCVNLVIGSVSEMFNPTTTLQESRGDQPPFTDENVEARGREAGRTSQKENLQGR